MCLFPPPHCRGWPRRSDSRVLEQVVFHQRRSEWWNCERVNETSVHVVSVLLCFKVSDGLSAEYQTPFQLFYFFLFSFFSFWFRSIACFCGSCYTWTCVPWVCRLWTLDKIFFWWPARVTPILASSLQGRRDNAQFRSFALAACIKLTHFVSSWVGCTWRWCRGSSPSWRIQKWKSSLYTGPSWWHPATRPLSSH